MRRIKLTVAYDGTDYCGWQIQPNGITVEEVLNRALSRLTGEDIRVIGASRTDAGVHARGNVAVFDTESAIPSKRFSYAVNPLLPPDAPMRAAAEIQVFFVAWLLALAHALVRPSKAAIGISPHSICMVFSGQRCR